MLTNLFLKDKIEVNCITSQPEQNKSKWRESRLNQKIISCWRYAPTSIQNKRNNEQIDI